MAPAPHVDGDPFWGLVRSRQRGPLARPRRRDPPFLNRRRASRGAGGVWVKAGLAHHHGDEHVPMVPLKPETQSDEAGAAAAAAIGFYRAVCACPLRRARHRRAPPRTAAPRTRRASWREQSSISGAACFSAAAVGATSRSPSGAIPREILEQLIPLVVRKIAEERRRDRLGGIPIRLAGHAIGAEGHELG